MHTNQISLAGLAQRAKAFTHDVGYGATKRWIYETVSYSDEGRLAKVTFVGESVDQVFGELLGLGDGFAVSRFTLIQ